MAVVTVPFLIPGILAGLGAGLIAGSALAQPADASAAYAPADPPASSQSVIAQPQAAAVQSDAIDQQIADFTQDPAAHYANPNAAPAAPRQIHGEAGVAFGSSGYRSAYIATDIPIGKSSDLGIAVGETDLHPKGYGQIRNRSLAVSLNIGGGAHGAPVNCTSPTVAMDGRYLEPIWESRLHGEALARDQAGCGAPVAYRAPPRGEDNAGE